MRYLVFVPFVLVILLFSAFGQEKVYEKVQLNSNNTVLLRGVIDETSVVLTSLKLAKLVALRGLGSYPIYLVLDSPGGELEAGRALIEFVKVTPNVRTITIFAASMAAITVESLPGSRLITANGIMMFHRARGGIEGQFEVGELESRLAQAKAVVLGLEKGIAARMGITIDDYKAKAKDEYWLTAERALKDKAVDKIVDIVCSDELVKGRTKVSIETLFGAIELKFSNCPTLRGPIFN